MAGGHPSRVRSRIRVEGVVQGVGFRPFVHGLANRYGLAGLVGNDATGVFIEVEGLPVAVEALLAEVRERPPALAAVDRVSVTALPPTGERRFTIVTSVDGGQRSALVAPDTATCEACLAELSDPSDRRYRYPFLNCTDCGPRFTIVTDLPYDRATTTMAGFTMCRACAREYADPADRRFHAQPVCCPACGPALAFIAADGRGVAGDPIATAARWLSGGAVLAVKGLGGYHLAADAGAEAAVAALRARKHRPGKAFAVMAADLAAVRRMCHLGRAEAAALSGPRRPIVLLRCRRDAPLAAAVAPGLDELGVMLPYTGLHHLLARQLGRPFVLTSGNRSDEPIAHRDADARRRLAGVADAFLVHDRPIHVPVEDSVVRVRRGHPVPLRRSRGYAPEPLPVPWPFPRPVLGCGAELKSTVCLGTGHRAVLSGHLGDLTDPAARHGYAAAVAHLTGLFRVEPAVAAHDLHPDYPSTRFAADLSDLSGVELVGVQHHHAHLAACLADNGEAGPVVGVAFDGTGYGTDGTIWGGELMVADLAGFTRAGHLEPVPMPGGAAAIRQPWRMAAGYVHAAYGSEEPAGLAVAGRHGERWEAVRRLAAAGVNAPLTSSAGRLFDAVAALAGVRDEVSYEAQAAIELEQRADRTVRDGYPVRVTGGPGGGPVLIHGTDLVRAVVSDLGRGTGLGVVSARFHQGLAGAVVTAAARVATATDLSTVALSGGVFTNRLLLDAVAGGLRRRRLRVLTHRRVPAGDGGISLGQAVVAAARDRAAPTVVYSQIVVDSPLEDSPILE